MVFGNFCFLQKYWFAMSPHSEAINRLLPAEMLERVFHLLPPRDRMAVVLVCRWWREVGEVPALWTWVTITVTRWNLAVMPEVLEARRVAGVRRVVAWVVSEEVLEAVARHTGVQQLVIKGTYLPTVSPALVARVVAGRQEVVLRTPREDNLTPQQAGALCSLVAREAATLRRLDLGNSDLSTVEPGVLALAVARLEEVDLWRSRLTSRQAVALFAALDAPDSRLVSLALFGNDLGAVEAGRLGRVVNRLERVDLRACCLSTTQVTSVLSSCLASTRLTSLLLDWVEGLPMDLVTTASQGIQQLVFHRRP